MEIFLELLALAVRNRFTMLMVVIPIFVLSRIVSTTNKTRSAKRKIWTRTANFLFLASLLLFVFGTDFTNQLIFKHGTLGEGQIIDKSPTGDIYNEEPIIGYKVLIKPQKGPTVHTQFESDQFVLYPEPDDSYVYPEVGLRFTVKYLERNPETFVIVTNNDSPYANHLKCIDIGRKMREAKSKLSFDPENETYAKTYEKYSKEYLQLNCIKGKSPILNVE